MYSLCSIDYLCPQNIQYFTHTSTYPSRAVTVFLFSSKISEINKVRVSPTDTVTLHQPMM